MIRTSRSTSTPLGTSVRLWAAVFSARVVLSLLFTVALFLYLSAFPGWAVVDDVTHVKAAIAEIRPFKTFFRPLEQAVNILNVRWFGFENLSFARAVGFAGFLTVIASTYALGRLLPHSALPAALASGLVTVSSLATASVVQIDTLSQQFVTVFALLFLLSLLAAKARSSWGLYGLAYSFALLALLSKESAPGLVAAVPVAAFLIRPPKERMVRGLLGDLLGVVLVAALYAGLRYSLGVGFGGSVESGQYDLQISPARLVQNLALYGGSLLYTGGSTLDLFPSLKSGRALVSGLFTMMLLLPSLVGAVHLVRARKLGLPLLGFMLLTVAGTFPVVLTEQVSELYTYGSLPPYALLLGFCFPAGVGVLARRLRAPWVYPAAAVFAALLLAWSARGTLEKVYLTEALGRQSHHYFSDTRAFLETAPAGPLRLCWQDDQGAAGPLYSTFVMSPRLVAGRAMDFAFWLEGRVLYTAASGGPVSVAGAAAGEWLPPPAPFRLRPAADPERVQARGCTHEVFFEGDALRFALN